MMKNPLHIEMNVKKKGEEIDYAKMNGMTHEKLFSFFYKQKILKKKNKRLGI